MKPGLTSFPHTLHLFSVFSGVAQNGQTANSEDTPFPHFGHTLLSGAEQYGHIAKSDETDLLHFGHVIEGFGGCALCSGGGG